MGSIFLRAFSFVLIILIGAFLRNIGMLDESHADGVRKMLMNVTLPASIIVNFAVTAELNLTLVFLIFWGFAVDALMLAAALCITRAFPSDRDSVYQFGIPCLNVGTFVMPFIQSFLPGLGVVSACCFDTGNAVMCTGGVYAYITGRKNGRLDFAYGARKLLSSVPLITYVGMFLFTMCGGRLPEAAITLLTPMAQANMFMAMFMIGLYFRLDIRPEYVKSSALVLGVRLLGAILLSLATWFFFPFPLVEKQTLLFIYFAPLSALAPAYVAMLDGDSALASCINSLSIIVSMLAIPALAALFFS